MPENKLPNKFYSGLFVCAFALNWIWEISQTFAFEMSGLSTAKMLFFCTLASIIDGVVTVLIFWLMRKIFEKLDWKFYLVATALGAICAIIFEQFAFIFGLWSYGDKMPVLPLLGTGLLPLAQLSILVPLAIWLTARYKKIE